MSVESRLTALEEAQRLLRDAKWLQGRRMSAAAPNDNELVGFNATKGIWEPKSPSLQLARATSALTLTTSYQSITGDGDSSKVRLLLPSIGAWLVEAVVDFIVDVVDPNNLTGALFVDDSGSPESAGAISGHGNILDRKTVPQYWKITTTTANTPVELKAKKQTDAGTARALATHTTLMAIGIAGGTAAVGAHGDLSGVTSGQHHTQSHTLASHSTKPHSELSDAPTDAHHTKYTDANAVAAVQTDGATKQETYIPFGNEPEAGVTIFPT